MKTKTCTTCKETKNVIEFHKCSKSKIGFKSSCRKCRNSYNKRYISLNKDKLNKKSKEWYHLNKEKAKSQKKKWRQINKEYIKTYNKEYNLKNKQNISEYQKQYYKNNKIRIQNRNNIRLKNDNLYKIKRQISNVIVTSIQRGNFYKTSKTKSILGCSIEFFKQHIESQFLDWMAWENYGNCETNEYKCSWHLDHIIPVSSAKTEEEVVLLNHWSNFQPLCSKINISDKKDSVTDLCNTIKKYKIVNKILIL